MFKLSALNSFYYTVQGIKGLVNFLLYWLRSNEHHRQTVQKLKTDFINNFFRPAAYF